MYKCTESICSAAPFECSPLLENIPGRSTPGRVDVISEVAYLWIYDSTDILWCLAVSAWLFGIEVGLPSQIIRCAVDPRLFLLVGVFFSIFSLPGLQSNNVS